MANCVAPLLLLQQYGRICVATSMAEQQSDSLLICFFSLFLFQIFTRFGKVLKIVTFTKNSKYRFILKLWTFIFLKKIQILAAFFYNNFFALWNETIRNISHDIFIKITWSRDWYLYRERKVTRLIPYKECKGCFCHKFAQNFYLHDEFPLKNFHVHLERNGVEPRKTDGFRTFQSGSCFPPPVQ